MQNLDLDLIQFRPICFNVKQFLLKYFLQFQAFGTMEYLQNHKYDLITFKTIKITKIPSKISK